MKTLSRPQATVFLALFLSAMSTNLSSGQGTMISVSGPIGGQSSAYLIAGDMAAVSWIETGTYSDVNIYIDLGANSGAAGMAYLTTQIGPGTTEENNEVASASFAFPSTSSLVAIFSGLYLGAGTYYLIIQQTATGSGQYGVWGGTPSPDLVTAADVTANYEYAPYNATQSYAPATSFSETFLNTLDYLVIGTPVPTPEPSAICLFALGGGMGILALRRKRKSVSENGLCMASSSCSSSSSKPAKNEDEDEDDDEEEKESTSPHFQTHSKSAA